MRLSVVAAAGLGKRNGGAPAPFDPSALPGAAVYWDARDLSAGAVTSWTDRIASIELTGTGTKNGTGLDERVEAPQFISAAGAVATAGLVNTDYSTVWGVCDVFTVGSTSTPRALFGYGQSDMTSTGHGFYWFNYIGTYFKLVNQLGAHTPAGGVSYPTVNTKALWVVVRDGATTAKAHNYTEDGTSTGIGTPAWTPASCKFYAGRDWAGTGTWMLDGALHAFGVASDPIDATGLANLRTWANETFGVTA